jgi:hypothetical protein
MGSRYLFIVLYVFLEHHLSRGDYRRPDVPDDHRPHPGSTDVSERTGLGSRTTGSRPGSR